MADTKIVTIERKDEGIVSTTAHTPGLQPNAEIIAVRPWVSVLIRTGRAWSQVFLMLWLGAPIVAPMLKAATGLDLDAILPPTFLPPLQVNPLGRAKVSALVAGVTCMATATWNGVELTFKLDQILPRWRA